METEIKKTRGGVRPGSGRKKMEGRDLIVSFKTSNKANDRLNDYCQRVGLSRNEAITRLLEAL